jgi:hypothetical protein
MNKYINIVQNGLLADHNKLKKIILDEWPKIYANYYNQNLRGEQLYRFVMGDVADEADGLEYEIETKAQNDLGQSDSLDWGDRYPKSDHRSIGFEVLNKLTCVYKAGDLVLEDIPVILEFLDTPPGKELEAWDTWEKYWAGLDYPARRKKLLGEHDAV